MTSAFTPSDIVINPSTVVPSQDIQTPLTIRVSGVTNVYVPFSATSLCSVELQFSSAYTGWVTCYLEKLTNPQNINNLYALHFSIQKYRYFPGQPSSRSMAFDVAVATCNIFTEESSFSIVQSGCEIESAYMTFTAQEANSSIGLKKLSANQALEYSTDGDNWASMTTATTISLANSGDTVYIRGVLSGNNTSSNYTQFTMAGKVAASGNCNYLWNYENTDTPLKSYCGYNMFSGCTSLTTAPSILPATTLANYCYYNMFRGCTSLTTAPVLPATTLTQSCYRNMFLGCTSLTTTPVLPATTLASYCYQSMFASCTGLTTAPVLPATTLAEGCYQSMFRACSGLTIAPELPATTLASHCYYYMFQGCTSLATAPSILPATTLANNCCEGMFQGCAGLTTAPALPATTLAQTCYRSMFNGCSRLTTAPALPATTLSTNCYESMFYGCSSLNYIKCLATNISASDCTNGWVSGVASTGTFVKDINMAGWTTGDNGIPTGWVVEDYVPAVKFTAQETNSTIGLNKLSSYQTLEYSTDGNNWASMTTATTISLANSGDTVYVRGILSADNTVNNYTQFKMTGKVAASGNCNYLWNRGNPDVPLKQYCGHNMFMNCSSLTTAPELPATTLANYCYSNMFMTCTSLATAPVLPATTLAQSCYSNMFRSCTSLTTAPELPATTLAPSCYAYMFMNCNSLTTAPTLPATTLIVVACYRGMFYNCSSLTTAPVLSATTLASYCYQHMFQNCSNLNYIKCLATDISANDCTNGWVDGVASTGTFVKAANMTGWTTGNNGIPTNWTVEGVN